MVRKVEIENFKSIQKLDFELGRVNVIIGANGSGKSNILEAIAFASCAAENKLDNDYLFLRGIRVTENGNMMKSGFGNNKKSDVLIRIKYNINSTFNTILNYKGKDYIEWYDKNITNSLSFKDTLNLSKLLSNLKTFQKEFTGIDENSFEMLSDDSKEAILEEHFDKILLKFKSEIATNDESHLKDFIIYSPETSSLRNFDDDSAIEPIGTKGEGLFKLLKIISESKPKQFKTLKENLSLLEWFDDVNISSNVLNSEKKIEIKDRFINQLNQLDQKSANEGFLYLLFYFTIMISDYTPSFFAIDNIDSSLNPKLCKAVTERLTFLSKKQKKQIILTTHNPSILDGLDLNDDEQRLFVAYRNDDGHTKMRRIYKPKLPENVEPIKLSEMFTRGLIGGLPTNF